MIASMSSIAFPPNPDGDADAGAAAYQLRAGGQLVALIKLPIYSLLTVVGNPFAVVRRCVGVAAGRGSAASSAPRRERGAGRRGSTALAGEQGRFASAISHAKSASWQGQQPSVVPSTANTAPDAGWAFYVLNLAFPG